MSEEKRNLILPPNQCQLAEVWRQDWVVIAEEGTTIEDIKRPEYWAHVAAFMQPFNRVELRPESGEWTADLIVVETGRNWAKVHVVAVHNFSEANATAVPADKYRIEFKGPHKKHVVIRNTDNAVMQDGIPSKAEAQQVLTHFETNVG